TGWDETETVENNEVNLKTVSFQATPEPNAMRRAWYQVRTIAAHIHPGWRSFHFSKNKNRKHANPCG
ncbi:MAG TPA: hypothetical protein VNA17_02195, partial [Pyrinomonadaceae bacterium]|nr:hypothetical protein [Pyrinomonadaceae bacterium]